MSRYEKHHRLVDLGIPGMLPLYARETKIRDTETGREAKGLDWDNYRESDQRAWENLQKEEE